MMPDFRNRFAVLLIPAALLIGCESIPAPGEKFVMVIKTFPSKRQEIEDYPGLSLALKRGVTREDVTSGRLVKSGCYFAASKNSSFGRRFGFTLLPVGLKVPPETTMTISAEEVDRADGPYAQFFSHYTRNFNASKVDYFKHKYLSGDVFRCRPISPSGEMEVAVISTVKYWDYDFAKAELSRNDQIRDDELLAGRIATGECSSGIDSWIFWNVRIPDRLDVKVGDFIEAIAGSYSRSTSTGAIPNAIRKVAPPPTSDYIGTPGRRTVSCSAHADPAR